MSVGRARRVFDYALTYAAEREQFGQPIGKFQGISFQLADMITEIDAADLLTLAAADRLDKNLSSNREIASAKLYATEMLSRVTDTAIQIHGGMGLMDDYPLERFWRDARSLAVIGGGAWGEAVLTQAKKFGFEGNLYAVHPVKPEATIGAVERMRKLEVGGAVCFASGYAEANGEDTSGTDAQARLLRAAGDMPILGPNCYGFINALDGVAVWPDQHGCKRVDTGVAILTQSSNISINMTMQTRGLPIGYMITAGNQAQTTQADVALALLDDPRVTAIGLHIEGFGDLSRWEALAAKAHAKSIPLVALKVGKSSHAQQATISHTASLAGGDTAAQAFLDRLGILRSPDVPSFLETLKLLHVAGRLPSNQISSISCSGGEASLVADMANEHDLTFPALTDDQKQGLFKTLGPKVALANPLDYHTYIWRDEDAMTDAWSAMAASHIALTLVVLDYPRGDICDATDWACATNAALRMRKATGRPVAVAASLPELLPEHVAQQLIEGDVVPFAGIAEALNAIEAASRPAYAPSSDAVLRKIDRHRYGNPVGIRCQNRACSSWIKRPEGHPNQSLAPRA
ncbi:putative acyl-CoA dehydrogenase YngJ [Nymphon striatum]|nr:putative acyl-CoA dehydrogenase YngJ [Nymphon striatum]